MKYNITIELDSEHIGEVVKEAIKADVEKQIKQYCADIYNNLYDKAYEKVRSLVLKNDSDSLNFSVENMISEMIREMVHGYVVEKYDDFISEAAQMTAESMTKNKYTRDKLIKCASEKYADMMTAENNRGNKNV